MQFVRSLVLLGPMRRAQIARFITSDVFRLESRRSSASVHVQRLHEDRNVHNEAAAAVSIGRFLLLAPRRRRPAKGESEKRKEEKFEQKKRIDIARLVRVLAFVIGDRRR